MAPSFSKAVLLALAGSAAAKQYTLTDTWDKTNFFTKFGFFEVCTYQMYVEA